MATKVQQMRQQALRQRSAANRALIANPRVQFADWLKRNHPAIFDDALAFAERAKEQRLARQAGVTTGDQLGQWAEGWTDIWAAPTTTTTEDKSFWQKFMDAAVVGGTAWLGYKQQKDLLALNIERAKAGLPPLDTAAAAPVIRTEVSIDSATVRDLASNVGAGINKTMLMVGGLALVAMFFFMRK